MIIKIIIGYLAVRGAADVMLQGVLIKEGVESKGFGGLIDIATFITAFAYGLFAIPYSVLEEAVNRLKKQA